MKNLAIVGTHPDTRNNAPYDDQNFDIWVFNEAPQAEWCKRWTACFQLHKPEVYTSPLNMVRGDHWDWLQQDHGHDHTIYMQEIDERVPCSARYPLDEIRMYEPAAAFGWFTSTVTYAMALALYLGYKRVEIYGVDLSSNTEYAYQQPCWLYWVGAAKSVLGDGLVLKSGQHHFAQRLYGYEGEAQIDRAYFKTRADEYEAKQRQAETGVKKLKDRINEAIADGRADKLSELIVSAQDAAMVWGEASGAYQEASGYAAREDPISRQQFERRGAQAQNHEMPTAMGEVHRLRGVTGYVMAAWTAHAGNAEALKQLRAFIEQYIMASYRAGGLIGVAQENFHYMKEYDDRVTAAGGQRTLQALGVA